MEAITTIKNNWISLDLPGASVKNDFYDDFLEASKEESFRRKNLYHCIELLGNKALNERIIGLVESGFLKPKKYHLHLILTKPELSAYQKERPLKNIGEILLGKVINEAKNNNASSLKYFPLDEAFFEKTFRSVNIKLKNRYTCFTLSNKFFDNYLKYWLNKFQVKDVIEV